MHFKENNVELGDKYVFKTGIKIDVRGYYLHALFLFCICSRPFKPKKNTFDVREGWLYIWQD